VPDLRLELTLMSILHRYDATVVGSGFAGSLLARILASKGWRVLLVERRRHPRFAIGESSTPLANLSLERLGRRYGFPELIDLAAHGRWLRTWPEVGRGLKRGFSFYRHQRGEPYEPMPGNTNRLLVAASPNDFVADTQWLRSEVDQFFFARASDSGVRTLEQTELDRVELNAGGVRLSGVRAGERLEIETSLVVDASGEGGFLQRHLPIGTGSPLRTSSALLFGHFRDVPLLEEVVASEADWSAPYPEDWAAVHHLIDEGWIYMLRFDDGLVSAGALLEEPFSAAAQSAPEGCWNDLLGRYPTLQALFHPARVERPVASGKVQRRLSRTHGPRWVVLPHTYGFVDPLFSTGIAWSLLGVERLADSLLRQAPDAPAVASGEAFGRYGELLALEIEQVDRLIFAAYRARGNFEVFAAQAMLYCRRQRYAGGVRAGNRSPHGLERCRRLWGLDPRGHRAMERRRTGGPGARQPLPGRLRRSGRRSGQAGAVGGSNPGRLATVAWCRDRLIGRGRRPIGTGRQG